MFRLRCNYSVDYLDAGHGKRNSNLAQQNILDDCHYEITGKDHKPSHQLRHRPAGRLNHYRLLEYWQYKPVTFQYFYLCS